MPTDELEVLLARAADQLMATRLDLARAEFHKWLRRHHYLRHGMPDDAEVDVMLRAVMRRG